MSKAYAMHDDGVIRPFEALTEDELKDTFVQGIEDDESDIGQALTTKIETGVDEVGGGLFKPLIPAAAGSCAWLGDSLTANGSTPVNVFGTVAATSAACRTRPRAGSCGCGVRRPTWPTRSSFGRGSLT